MENTGDSLGPRLAPNSSAGRGHGLPRGPFAETMIARTFSTVLASVRPACEIVSPLNGNEDGQKFADV